MNDCVRTDLSHTATLYPMFTVGAGLCSAPIYFIIYTIILGGAEPRPYDLYDFVNMIGHYNKRMQFHHRETMGQIVPNTIYIFRSNGQKST